jgi:diguanylate cyclase (GGDEF)-like protein
MSSSHAHPQVDVEYLTRERKRFDEQRRTVYLLVGVLGFLLLSYDLYTQVVSESSSRLAYIINDSLFALCSLVFIYLDYSRQIKLDVLERGFFIFLAFESFVFNSLAPFLFHYTLQEVFTETIADDVWLLLLVCVKALYLFRGRRGALLAAGFYLVSLGVTCSYLLTHWAPDTNLISLSLQNYLAGAMVLGFLCLLTRYRDNVQRLSLQYEILEKVAFLDALTGLYNRRRIYEVMEQQLELSGRYGTPFCIALLDIDHFKRINDTFGHLKGDEILQQVATVLRSHLRNVDKLGRWGGEEFLLVLPQASLEEGIAAAERSRQTIEVQVSVEGRAVTLSCGVTQYLPDDEINVFLQRADDALYKAKEQGRNRVVSSGETYSGNLTATSGS